MLYLHYYNSLHFTYRNKPNIYIPRVFSGLLPHTNIFVIQTRIIYGSSSRNLFHFLQKNWSEFTVLIRFPTIYFSKTKNITSCSKPKLIFGHIRQDKKQRERFLCQSYEKNMFVQCLYVCLGKNPHVMCAVRLHSLCGRRPHMMCVENLSAQLWDF